jgi:GntR family transcriptional regulator
MLFHLDHESPIPLHYQLLQQLRAAIEEGTLRSGDTLPSEPELAASAGVSRATVRQAFDRLAREGLLLRRQGRKTVIQAAPYVPAAPTYSYMFSDPQMENAPTPDARVLEVDQIAPPADVRDVLQLGPNDLVLAIDRVRTVNDVPVGFERILLPSSRVPGLTRSHLDQGSLYDLLERRYGLAMVRAEETLEATPLQGDVARQLSVADGSAGFLATRFTFAGESVIEVRYRYIPGERFRGTLTLSRGQMNRD